mgnify:CR=1 FL=1
MKQGGMMFDVIIIGGGPGGYIAAEEAGILGLSTALIEKDTLGGTCLNRGCIPTKSMLNSIKLYKHAQHASQFGITAQDVHLDFGTVMNWKNQTVAKLVAGIDFLMKKHAVTVYKGKGALLEPHKVRIEETGEVLEGTHIIIASGSEPALPPLQGIADNPAVLTSDSILNLTTLPASLCIIGGGVIGMEFANFFASAGSDVHVIEMLPEVLPFMDSEAVSIYKRTLRGIDIHTDTKVLRLEGSTVVFEEHGTESSLTAEKILIATGRKPVFDASAYEKLGITCTKMGITVDDYCRTSVPNVWAIGDVTGRAQLAHTASAMGRAVSLYIAGMIKRNEKPEQGSVQIPWESFPWVVYGEPECAGVGLTETQAEKAGIEYVKAVIPARANGRFLAEQGQMAHGLCKMLTDKATKKIIGVHLVLPYAGEMIWGMQYALMQGATVYDIAKTVFPHPTISEIMHDCVIALIAQLD